jgi:two-component sensor histidine kinase
MMNLSIFLIVRNFFSFDFSGIRTTPSKKIKYQYKLEGFDQDWRMTDHIAHAGYTNVPAGHYRFVIKATNELGQWSDALLAASLVIHPPYWHTWWFYLLCFAAVSALAYAIHAYRIQQVKKIILLRTQISRDLHDDIGASLSSINIYSSVAESQMSTHPEKARQFLQQISTSSRQVMEDISDLVWANRTDRHESDSLSERIKNYGHDLLSQKNIECHYFLDEFAEKKLTKPEARRNILLIIKEAMHNIAKYSGATHAEIRMSLNGISLLLTIKDNGRGFELNEVKKGNGLLFMRKRAESLKGTLEIHAEVNGGTTIYCKIPITKISD